MTKNRVPAHRSRIRAAAQPPTGARLSREATRCLQALGKPDAVSIQDPVEEDSVLVKCAKGKVSLGSGRFARTALDELLRHGLAERSTNGAPDATLSSAGAARLRRNAHGGEDSFQAQHRDLAATELVDEGERRRVAVNAAESPLAWLRQRRDREGEPLIDAACFEAGERLRRDITQACLLPGVTSRWDPSAGSGGAGPRDPAAMTDMVIAARQRARRAFAALGSDFADLLIDLCGFLKGLETLERERGWPPRSGKVVVRLALARLADHYGLRPVAEGRGTSAGIRTWHALLEGADGPSGG